MSEQLTPDVVLKEDRTDLLISRFAAWLDASGFSPLDGVERATLDVFVNWLKRNGELR